MQLYTWAVVQDCRIVGYVRAYSEWDAMKFAEMKYGSRLFVERVYLGDWIGQAKEQTNETV
jgi:hypothetical protein